MTDHSINPVLESVRSQNTASAETQDVTLAKCHLDKLDDTILFSIPRFDYEMNKMSSKNASRNDVQSFLSKVDKTNTPAQLSEGLLRLVQILERGDYASYRVEQISNGKELRRLHGIATVDIYDKIPRINIMVSHHDWRRNNQRLYTETANALTEALMKTFEGEVVLEGAESRLVESAELDTTPSVFARAPTDDSRKWLEEIGFKRVCSIGEKGDSEHLLVKKPGGETLRLESPTIVTSNKPWEE